MKKMIVLLVLVFLSIQVAFCLADSNSQIPPPVFCEPDIVWQAHLLILPLCMSVVSYDESVSFDQNSEIKIADKEIIKFFQIYINEKTIFVFLLILPAGLDALSGQEKIIDVDVTSDKLDITTAFRIYVLGWPL